LKNNSTFKSPKAVKKIQTKKPARQPLIGNEKSKLKTNPACTHMNIYPWSKNNIKVKENDGNSP
jgi:hypothetical protein